MSKKSLTSESVSLSESISSIAQVVSISCLHLMMIFVPLFFLVKNEEIFEFNKMLATYAFTTIIITGWLISIIARKKIHWKSSPVDWFIVLFFLSQLASTALSIHPRTSFFGYYTRFHGGLFSIVAYISLFYAVINLVGKKWIMSLLTSILIGGFLASVYAFPEHFGHSPSCIFLTGTFDASCWIQDVQTRVFGTFGQPNWLAAFLITLIPLSLYMMVRSIDQEKTIRRLIRFSSATLFFLMLATLLFTKSRSGFLGLCIGMGVFLLIFCIQQVKRNQFRSIFTLLTVIVIGSALIIAVFGSPFTPALSERIGKSNTVNSTVQEAPVALVEIGGTDSGDIRRIVWKGAIDVWKRYPLFGSGVETFAYSYYRDRPVEHNLVSEWDFLYNKAHNELLNYLATTGIIGLVSYLLLQAAIGIFLLKQSIFNSDEDTQLLSAAVLGSSTALHISNFFGFSTVMVSILMYVLPAIVISSVVHSDSTVHNRWNPFSILTRKLRLVSALFQTKSSSVDFSTAQGIGIISVLMIAVMLLVNIYSIWLGDFLYAQAKGSFRANETDLAFKQIKQAITLSPNEALYYELYSKIAAQYAIAALEQNETELGSSLANSAIEASQTSLLLNPVHLNFYKSRNQILVVLAQANAELFPEALETLALAQQLAPTDPKLVYFQGVIEFGLGNYDKAISALKKAVELKPNYDSARYQLGLAYEEQKQFDQAREQYEYILEKIAPGNVQVQERMNAIATMSGSR